MSTVVGRLEAILTANTAQFERAMTTSESRMQRTGKAAGVLGLALAGGLAIGMKHAITDASNLHEQITKTDVVFGKNAKQVEAWAGHLAKSFGLSDRAALEATATYGNMLKPMGIAPRLVANMSTKMTELAGDMASFNNASPEDTLRAIQSGLAGQVRPLRQYGVFLDQTRIKLEAVSAGLVKAEIDQGALAKAQVKLKEDLAAVADALQKHGKGSMEYAKASAQMAYDEEKVNTLLQGKVPALTAAQKAQATYNLIMKDTADTHGDFIRTSGGVANQQRILRAEMENLSAEMGKSLLPIMVQVMQAMTTMIGFLEKHSRLAKALAVSLGVLAGALLTARAAQLLLNLAVFANPYVAAATAIGALVAALVILQVKYNAVSNAVNFLKQHEYALLAVPIIGQFAGIIIVVDKLSNHVGGLADAFRKVAHWVGTAVDAVKSLIDLLGKIHIPHFSLPHIGGFGDGDGGGPFGGSGAAEGRAFNVGRQLWDEIGMGENVGLRVTSGYRAGAITKHGTPSDHGYNPSRAVDMAGPPGAMALFFNSLIGRREIRQAFYDPLGSIFNGAWSSYREGGHSDHVHVAEYDRGGWLPTGPSLAINNTGRPERVVPPGGDNVVIPISIGGEHVATVLFDFLRRKAKVYENRNGRLAFGGM